MTTHNPFSRRARLSLAVSLTSSLAAPTFGVTFNTGEIGGSLDSALSVGASWSTAKPNRNLIGVNSGGGGLSQTSDDSHLNFKRGETFSKVFEGIHDLELRYGDTGVFLRGKYWYDFEPKGEHREFKDIDDSGRKALAKSSGAEPLDAFIYHNYAIGGLLGSVRLGKQAVNWGESTFTRNDISAINPIDVTAFRRPGSGIKENLIPVNMFYLSQNLTDSLSAEGFYQIEWNQTVADNCGTFFSQPDVMADGCDRNLTVLTDSKAFIGLLNNVFAGAGLSVTPPPWDEGILVRRGPDHDTRDSGQCGFAPRYFVDELNTGFGAYYMNCHGRLPIFSDQGASASTMAAIDDLVTHLATINPALATQTATAATAGNSSYFIEYSEDIRMFSLSFSATLPNGTAQSGEASYRPSAPVQLNTTDILFVGLDPVSIGDNRLCDSASVLNGQAGQDLYGYRRKEITQLQTTLTYFFDRMMGAEHLTLVGEIGWTHIGGLESTSKACYGRGPVFGPGSLSGTISDLASCQALNISALGTAGADDVSRYCENDGYTTSDAQGYRACAIWDYNGMFVNMNLELSVAWSHDVDGYSSGPGANFEEDRKAVNLGVDAEYQNTYTTSLSYTNFFDGEYTTVDDRDFVAFSFGMNFRCTPARYEPGQRTGLNEDDERIKTTKILLHADVLALSLLATQVMAAVSADGAVKLGTSLTPLGAGKAGSADDSIPAWDGDLATSAGNVDSRSFFVNPYASEQPLFTITAQNVDQYKDKLTPSQLAMFERYPDTCRIPVHKIHRGATVPATVQEAAKRNATTTKLVEGGNGLKNSDTADPSPIPQNGLEVIWDHITRYRSGNVRRLVTQTTPQVNGSYQLAYLQDAFTFRTNLKDCNPDKPNNVLFYFKQRITAPSRLADNVLLVHEALNRVKEPCLARLYNAGQHRVRRAPRVSYSGPGTTADGLRTSDNFDMYNDASDRYDWKLEGKRETYIPYNNYKLDGPKIKYSEIVKTSHINQDLTRYELHRVWHVIATLKPGERRTYAKRDFYIDEDTWQAAEIDHYGSRSTLWRVAGAHAEQCYDKQMPWYAVETLYDLLSGRYLTLGMKNREKQVYDFNYSASKSDYTPAALRQEGVR